MTVELVRVGCDGLGGPTGVLKTADIVTGTGALGLFGPLVVLEDLIWIIWESRKMMTFMRR